MLVCGSRPTSVLAGTKPPAEETRSTSASSAPGAGGADELSGAGPEPGAPAAVGWAQAPSRSMVTAAAAVHKPRSLVIACLTYPTGPGFLPLSGKYSGVRRRLGELLEHRHGGARHQVPPGLAGGVAQSVGLDDRADLESVEQRGERDGQVPELVRRAHAEPVGVEQALPGGVGRGGEPLVEAFERLPYAWVGGAGVEGEDHPEQRLVPGVLVVFAEHLPHHLGDRHALLDRLPEPVETLRNAGHQDGERLRQMDQEIGLELRLGGPDLVGGADRDRREVLPTAALAL